MKFASKEVRNIVKLIFPTNRYPPRKFSVDDIAICYDALGKDNQSFT
jgi:hypothetical protein